MLGGHPAWSALVVFEGVFAERRRKQTNEVEDEKNRVHRLEEAIGDGVAKKKKKKVTTR